MENSIIILILEDNYDDAFFIKKILQNENPRIKCLLAQNEKEFLQLLKEYPIDCIVSDYSLPGYNGEMALEAVMAYSTLIPLIIVSGVLGDERAADIVRKGAFNFVLKNNLKRLPNTVKNALDERKEKEEKIKAQQELQHTIKALTKSNDDLAQFTFVASHDLKTPISNLINLVDILEQSEGIKGHCLEVFEKTKQSVHRMDGTIKALNKVIAIKQTHKDVEKDALLLVSEFEEVKSSFETKMEEIGAEIHTDFSACSSLRVDRIHLQSILQNLLSNAIKYRIPSQKLVIEVRTSIVDQYICLSFQDNGEGIDLEAYGEKVFMLFQRFNLSVEGMGAGLHMIKSMVENSGGYVDIESQPKMGTTFYLYFPYSLHPEKDILELQKKQSYSVM